MKARRSTTSNSGKFLLLLCLLSLSSCKTFSGQKTDSATANELAGGPTRLATVNSHQKAEACLKTAAELARHGRDDSAIKEYLHARDFDTKIKGVSHPLAVLYDRKGMADAAEREYQLALSESPKNADLLNDYGYFLYSRGDLEKAEGTLRKSLKIQARHPKARLNLALVLAECKEYDKSLHEFQESVGDAAAHHNLGVILARHGEIEQARSHLQIAANLDPSLTQTRELLACMDAKAASGKVILPASLEVLETTANSRPAGQP